MEQGIIEYGETIEIHPGPGGWSVVRGGQVYGTYIDFQEAEELAQELADKEGDHDDD